MKRGRWLLAIVVLSCGLAQAAGPRLELSEAALNKVISTLGTLADGGVAQPYNIHSQDPLTEICFSVGVINCPGFNRPDLGMDFGEIPLVVCKQYGGGISALPSGPPVSWQWWVSNAYIKLDASAMTFTATVLTRVGDYWEEETRTVAASVVFDTANKKLRLKLDNFEARLTLQNSSMRLDAAPVDVSGMYAIAMDVPSQNFSVPIPGGLSRSVNARILSATPSYAPGKLTVEFDVAF